MGIILVRHIESTLDSNMKKIIERHDIAPAHLLEQFQLLKRAWNKVYNSYTLNKDYIRSLTKDDLEAFNRQLNLYDMSVKDSMDAFDRAIKFSTPGNIEIANKHFKNAAIAIYACDFFLKHRLYQGSDHLASEIEIEMNQKFLSDLIKRTTYRRELTDKIIRQLSVVENKHPQLSNSVNKVREYAGMLRKKLADLEKALKTDIAFLAKNVLSISSRQSDFKKEVEKFLVLSKAMIKDLEISMNKILQNSIRGVSMYLGEFEQKQVPFEAIVVDWDSYYTSVMDDAKAKSPAERRQEQETLRLNEVPVAQTNVARQSTPERRRFPWQRQVVPPAHEATGINVNPDDNPPQHQTIPGDAPAADIPTNQYDPDSETQEIDPETGELFVLKPKSRPAGNSVSPFASAQYQLQPPIAQKPLESASEHRQNSLLDMLKSVFPTRKEKQLVEDLQSVRSESSKLLSPTGSDASLVFEQPVPSIPQRSAQSAGASQQQPRYSSPLRDALLAQQRPLTSQQQQTAPQGALIETRPISPIQVVFSDNERAKQPRVADAFPVPQAAQRDNGANRLRSRPTEPTLLLWSTPKSNTHGAASNPPPASNSDAQGRASLIMIDVADTAAINKAKADLARQSSHAASSSPQVDTATSLNTAVKPQEPEAPPKDVTPENIIKSTIEQMILTLNDKYKKCKKDNVAHPKIVSIQENLFGLADLATRGVWPKLLRIATTREKEITSLPPAKQEELMGTVQRLNQATNEIMDLFLNRSTMTDGDLRSQFTSITGQIQENWLAWQPWETPK